MKDATCMLRVSKDLRDELKKQAKAEGRTLEFMANEALFDYLNNTDKRHADERLVRAHIVNEGVDLGKLPESSRVAVPEPTYEPIDPPKPMGSIMDEVNAAAKDAGLGIQFCKHSNVRGLCKKGCK